MTILVCAMIVLVLGLVASALNDYSEQFLKERDQ